LRLVEEGASGGTAGFGEPDLRCEARQEYEQGPHVRALVEHVRGEHQVKRRLPDQLIRPRPVDGRGLHVHVVRLGIPPDELEGLRGVVGGEHRRARARSGEARRGEPAAELHDAPAAKIGSVQLPREGDAAPPEDRPVGHDRGPFDVALVGQLGRLPRLEQAKLAGRQVDRLGDQVLGHGRSLGRSAKCDGEGHRASSAEEPFSVATSIDAPSGSLDARCSGRPGPAVATTFRTNVDRLTRLPIDHPE